MLCGGEIHHSSQRKIKIDAINEKDKPQAYQSKKINLSEKNQTKVCHWINQCYWINQGFMKELKQKTQ